jgi:6-pyruvoyltetrahydropterin/6-carboxytetrahydropterin synthase
MLKTTLTVSFEFSASHRLFRPELSDQENTTLFGKCANPNGHGHNYTLEVSVGGQIEPRSGMVIDASRLKAIVEEVVLADVDHKDLNRDTPWMKGKIPSSEILAQAIFERLSTAVAKECSTALLDSITLHETRRISVTVSRDQR